MNTIRLLVITLVSVLAICAQTFDDFDMPAAVPLPDAKLQFLDTNGNPLAGGKVYFYEAGTTTPQDTYTSSTGATPNANPVVLDSAGRASIWIKGESYKIVVKNSADVTQWTEDNVTDTTFFYLEHLRAISDSALLAYKPSIGGSVPGAAVERSIQSRLSERVSVKDFGAIGDGTSHPVQEWCTNHGGTRYTAANDGACLTAIQADYPDVAAVSDEIDGAAIQAAMDLLDDDGGALVYLPVGTYMVSDTLIVPRGIRLTGASPSSSIIKAVDGVFPTGSPVIEVGDPASPSVALHYASVQDLVVDAASITGSTCIKSIRAQELTILSNLLLVNFDAYGIDYSTFGIQNTRITDITAQASATATTAVGIRLYSTISRIDISNVSVVAYAAQTTPGILLDSAYGVSVRNAHIENHAQGVYLDNGTQATVDTVSGNSTVTSVIQIEDRAFGVFFNIHSNSSTNAILDNYRSNTITDETVAAYIVGYSGGVLSTAASVANSISVLDVTDLSADTLDLGILKFSEVSSLPIATHGTLGLMLQNANVTAGAVGGGLTLIGNGYANDADYGEVGAGYTGDMGTRTARSATPAGISFYDGTAEIFANAAATPGATFTPSTFLKGTSEGLQITPKVATPTCATSADVGKLWVSNPSLTTAVKICVNTGATFAFYSISIAP